MKRNKSTRFAAALTMVALLVLAGSGLPELLGKTGRTATQPAVHIDPDDLAVAERLSRVFNQIAKKVSNSVVHIDSVKKAKTSARRRGGSPFEDEDVRRFFGPHFRFETPRSRRPQRGLGSGVIIAGNGYVLTNYHVVRNADTITVVLPDGRSFTSEWVREDPETDLALVKIKAKGLPALQFADSDHAQVGDWVVAVGNPFGLDNTVTKGIISYLGRGVQISQYIKYANFIQTDAPINPGNSGGPLVNLKGQIIGINTAILSGTASFAGIGLAIPAKTARFVAEQLKENKQVVRSYLGVQLGNLTGPLAKSFGLDANKGALIETVIPDTPAGKAGFNEDDIVLEFGDVAIRNNEHLRTLVSQSPPGKSFEAIVWRDGREKTLSVTLEKMPEDFLDRRYTGPGEYEREGREKSLERIGITVKTLTEELADKLGHDQDLEGVVITDVEPDSEAARLRLQQGDVILRVYTQRVRNVTELIAALKKHEDREGVRLKVAMRGGAGRRSVYLRMR